MGHLGFSWMGLVFLSLLFLPNLLWTKAQPQGYSPQGESKVLRLFERTGETACSGCALLFQDFNPQGWSLWSLWLAGSLLLMLLYELWWIRYFHSERRLEDFYSSLMGIPVAGATLPVAAFLLLGVYGKVVWMVLAALALGVGHIGIHLRHRRDLKNSFKK